MSDAQNQNDTQNQNPEQANQDAAGTDNPISNSLEDRVLELENQLKEAQTQNQNLTQTAQRALADLQNFKRRTEEERSQFVQFASANFAREIIPFLDNLQRAFMHMPNTEEGISWAKSIENIYTQLLKTLENLGFKKIETTNQPLDPLKHEALLQGPGPKDQIIEELEPGYMLGENILKSAKVKIGNGETV